MPPVITILCTLYVKSSTEKLKKLIKSKRRISGGTMKKFFSVLNFQGIVKGKEIHPVFLPGQTLGKFKN